MIWSNLTSKVLELFSNKPAAKSPPKKNSVKKPSSNDKPTTKTIKKQVERYPKPLPGSILADIVTREYKEWKHPDSLPTTKQTIEWENLKRKRKRIQKAFERMQDQEEEDESDIDDIRYKSKPKVAYSYVTQVSHRSSRFADTLYVIPIDFDNNESPHIPAVKSVSISPDRSTIEKDKQVLSNIKSSLHKPNIKSPVKKVTFSKTTATLDRTVLSFDTSSFPTISSRGGVRFTSSRTMSYKSSQFHRGNSL